jgi:hypothetical protein
MKPQKGENMVWEEEQEKVFEEIKRALTKTLLWACQMS